MAWLYLIIAGLLEVVWASWLKKTDGFTKLGPSLITIGVMCVSFYLLGVALKTLPTGTGYAVWVGIGAVGTALVGLVARGDAATPARLGFLALLVVAVAGLKLVGEG